MSHLSHHSGNSHRRRVLLAAGSASATLAVVVAVAVLYARPLLAGPALTQLVVAGNLQHVSPQAVRAAVHPQIGSGFFTTDVDAVRAAVAALPWVEAVSVRRGWPHTLYINIDEETPAARWDADGLMDAQGHVFTRSGGQAWGKLPQLSGPDGSSVAVLNEYHSFSALLAPKGLAIRQMDVDARGSATLTLSDGIRVRLGRQQAQVRLERFAAVALQVLATQLPQVAYVDMRYTNGFAVGYCGSAGGTPATANARQGSRAGLATMDGSGPCAERCAAVDPQVGADGKRRARDGAAGQPTADGSRGCDSACGGAAQSAVSGAPGACATPNEAKSNG